MTYSIRLPQEIEERLENLSIQTGRSKSFYVKEAILEHLSEIEDIFSGSSFDKMLNTAMKMLEKQMKNLPRELNENQNHNLLYHLLTNTKTFNIDKIRFYDYNASIDLFLDKNREKLLSIKYV